MTVILASILLATVPTHTLFAQPPGTKTTAPVDYKKLYNEALADFNANRNLEAKVKFAKVLKKYPTNISCQRHLAQLNKRLRAEAAVPVAKRRLATVSIEKIDFTEATLAEVMEFVTRKTKEQSKGKIAPGLVIHGGDAVRDRLVTFKTGRPVPVDKLIDTVAQITNTKVKYGEYALTFTPLPTAKQLSDAAAKKLDEAEAKERIRKAKEDAAKDPFLKKR